MANKYFRLAALPFALALACWPRAKPKTRQLFSSFHR